jgi:hypothetical protein
MILEWSSKEAVPSTISLAFDCVCRRQASAVFSRRTHRPRAKGFRRRRFVRVCGLTPITRSRLKPCKLSFKPVWCDGCLVVTAVFVNN